MLRQAVIELGGDSLDFGQAGAGDVREVVVLHMVAHVEREVVPRAVVGVGLVASVEHVVLCDKVGTHRVEAHAQECTGDEIHQRLHPKEVENEPVEDYLHDIVEDFQLCGRFGAYKRWPNSIKKRLQKEPE